MLATGLSAPTQSGVGIAAATVSPMISYEISQKFKELAKDNADGKLTEKQQAAHVLAHAVLGAAVAAAGGNDALAGGASAGGAEYLAPKVSEFLYGTADPEKLTAEQKDTVANIMSLAGAGVGAAVGNTSANAVSGSLNAESAVENNFSLQDVKDNWNRLTGGLLGVAASFGSAGEPILHPIDTWNGLKEFANSDDKLAVLQMGLILTVEERNQDYETFVRLNDEFGRGMVIGRSVTDIASAVSTVSKTPALFKTALAQLRKTGHATINGVKVVYVSGKIARALDNYVAPVQIYKPVPAITQTAKKLPQGKGGQNTLVTRERVNSNIQETRRGNQNSQFGTHAQQEMKLEQPVTANGQANVKKLQIETGQQNKHIVGTNEYTQAVRNGVNKSILEVEPQVLLPKIGGGQQVGNIRIGLPGSKERINFNYKIGQYYDNTSGKFIPTTIAIVHYSKRGIHIVPARPQGK